MKSAWAWAQRPETLISILPLSEGPPVRTRPLCSMTKLVGRWQVAKSCSHWAFLGAQKAKEELEYFLKCKAVKQIEFIGSTLLFFTISTEAPNLASSTVPRSLYFPFMRCRHSIIFARVGLLPFDLERWREGRQQYWRWGLIKEEKYFDLE